MTPLTYSPIFPARKNRNSYFSNQESGNQNLVLDRKFIESRIAGTKERLESVRQYLLDQSVCRSRYLVQYFGEADSDDCGICDICIGRKKEQLSHQDFEIITDKVTAVLDEPRSLQYIAQAISVDHEKVSVVIKWLTDHGRVARTEDGRIYNKKNLASLHVRPLHHPRCHQ